MPRKKKETLVHLDLDTLSKEVIQKKPLHNDDAAPASLGSILKKAREKKKLTLAEVAQKLRIKEIFLEALEKGHYYVFPGLAYGVGFLRTYALFLGLDAKELINQFHAETSSIKVEPIEMPIPQNSNLMPSFKTILKAVITLLIVYLIWYITVNMIKPAPIESNPPVVEQIDRLTDAKTNIDAPIMADSVSPEAENVKMKTDSFPLKDKTTSAKVYGSESADGLSFVANEEVWIEITQDGQPVLNTVLYKGDRYNVPAGSNYKLNTANAGALTVYVNGKKKNTLGSKGTLAENVVLNIQNFK